MNKKAPNSNNEKSKTIAKNRKPMTLIEEAYRRIKQMILEQRFDPGQRLGNRELRELLNMSGTPVINALNRLVQDGFLGFESFRGFYVKPIDLQEIWDTFGVREALEVYTVEQAIKLAGPDDFAPLDETLQKHKEYVPHYYTRLKFQLDMAFHLQIAAMAKNAVLRYLLKRNLEHVLLRARLDNYDHRRMNSSAEEHERLVRLMKKKDIIRSVEAVQSHVHKARDHVIMCLSDEEPPAETGPPPTAR
jgi:DNA-binding GntR family transcriptional regulator